MPSSAWKDLELRVCRALGAERRPSVGRDGWARGSDDDGTCVFAVETKRSKRRVPEGRWIEQAKRNGRATRRPWLLVVAAPGDRVGPGNGYQRPVAVLDFWELVELAQKAGVVPEIRVGP